MFACNHSYVTSEVLRIVATITVKYALAACVLEALGFLERG